jgi:hypothetical protein
MVRFADKLPEDGQKIKLRIGGDVFVGKFKMVWLAKLEMASTTVQFYLFGEDVAWEPEEVEHE